MIGVYSEVIIPAVSQQQNIIYDFYKKNEKYRKRLYSGLTPQKSHVTETALYFILAVKSDYPSQ